MSGWNISVCQTCLSDNRALYPVCKLKIILKELYFLQFQNLEGGICWECRFFLAKIYQFKIQAIRAQNILRYNLQLKYIGRLSKKTKNEFDNEFCHIEDPLKYEECPIKVELLIKSEENVISNEDSLSVTSEDYKRNFESLDIVENELTEKDFISKAKIPKNVKKKALENGIENGSGKENITKTDNKTVLVKNKKQPAPSKTQLIEVPPDVAKLNDRRETDCDKPEPTTILIEVPPDMSKLNDTRENNNEKVIATRLTEEELLSKRERKWLNPCFQSFPYKCETCVLGFKTQENYDAHADKLHHEKNGPDVCPICAARFPNKYKLETHVDKHFNTYRCTACEFESTLHHVVMMHNKDKHAERMADSNSTYITYVDRVYMSTHRMFTCDRCGEVFRNKRTLHKHKVRVHEENNEYICDICNKIFRMKSRLETHMGTHRAKKPSNCYCAECDVTYKNARIYRAHFKTSSKHADRQYKCKECNKEFFNKVYYNKHYEFYHLKKSKYKCEDCDKLFISHSRLINHEQVHHGSNRPRKHTCEECNKSFFTKGMLRSHRLTHSSQRSFMCEECGDTFKQRAALYTHTRLVHKNVKKPANKLPDGK